MDTPTTVEFGKCHGGTVVSHYSGIAVPLWSRRDQGPTAKSPHEAGELFSQWTCHSELMLARFRTCMTTFSSSTCVNITNSQALAATRLGHISATHLLFPLSTYHHNHATAKLITSGSSTLYGGWRYARRPYLSIAAGWREVACFRYEKVHTANGGMNLIQTTKTSFSKQGRAGHVMKLLTP